jgi:hypothetical protein
LFCTALRARPGQERQFDQFPADVAAPSIQAPPNRMAAAPVARRTVWTVFLGVIAIVWWLVGGIP